MDWRLKAAWATSVPIAAFLLASAARRLPDAGWWDRASDPAVVVTIAIVLSATAYGCFKVWDELRQERARRERERDTALDVACRRAFVPINRHLPNVPVDAIGVHIWRIDPKTDSLMRAHTYTMEHARPRTRVEWRRGKGLLGYVWDTGAPALADLRPLYAKAASLSAADFDALRPDERWGMTHADAKRAGYYKAALAVPLTDPSSRTADVVAIMSVDIRHPVDAAALHAIYDDREFRDVIGTCETFLNPAS